MQLFTQLEEAESMIIVVLLTSVTLSSLTNKDTILYNNNKT